MVLKLDIVNPCHIIKCELSYIIKILSINILINRLAFRLRIATPLGHLENRITEYDHGGIIRRLRQKTGHCNGFLCAVLYAFPYLPSMAYILLIFMPVFMLSVAVDSPRNNQ
jgi:hypothetical protein